MVWLMVEFKSGLIAACSILTQSSLQVLAPEIFTSKHAKHAPYNYGLLAGMGVISMCNVILSSAGVYSFMVC